MVSALQILTAGAVSTLAVASPAARAPILASRQTDSTANVTTFASITPSPELNWKSCYAENFQCTYLTVPLDYQNISAGTTDVAFIRYLVNETLDDLLYNPGTD